MFIHIMHHSTTLYTHTSFSILKEPSHRERKALPPLPVKPAAKVPMSPLMKRNLITRFLEPTMAGCSPREVADSGRISPSKLHLHSSDEACFCARLHFPQCVSVTIYFHTADHTWDLSINSYAKENQTKAPSPTQKATRLYPRLPAG